MGGGGGERTGDERERGRQQFREREIMERERIIGGEQKEAGESDRERKMKRRESGSWINGVNNKAIERTEGGQRESWIKEEAAGKRERKCVGGGGGKLDKRQSCRRERGSEGKLDKRQSGRKEREEVRGKLDKREWGREVKLEK